MHEEVITEALKAFQQMDPDSKVFNEIVSQVSSAVSGQNNLIAVMALTAALTAIIDHSSNGNQDTTNFLYHLALGTVTKAGMEAHIFDEMMDEIEAMELENTEPEGNA